MIANDHQYRVTKANVAKFQRAIADMKADKSAEKDIDPRRLQARIDGMESQLSDLMAEVAEYEARPSVGKSV